MGRNPKHIYRYPHFDPCSLVWQRLMEDAAQTGKPIDDLIVIRLADFYIGGWAERPASKPEVINPAILTSDASKNALAAAQAWGDDDEDSPTEKMHAI